MAGNLREGGLRLIVEQYNEFMQQTGQASEAMAQFGKGAQLSAAQINAAFQQGIDLSTFRQQFGQLGEITNASLASVVDQLKYNVPDAAIEALTGLTSRAQDILQTVSEWKIPAPELNVDQWNQVAERMRMIYLTGGDSKAFADEFHRVAGEVVSESKKIADAEKEAAAEAERATNSFIALGAALTVLSAKASAAVVQMTLVASRVKELEILLEVTRSNAEDLAISEGRMADAAGFNATAVQEQVQAIRDLHLSGIVANETVAQLIRYQLDWTKASELAREAQDAATFAAQDSSQALEGIIKGIVTLQPRILRTYGIMVNLNEAYRDYAKENNLVADELAQIERQQAALNAVLAQAPRIAGAYEASLGSATKQIRSIYTDTQNLAEAYGEFLEPALAAAAGGVRDFMQWLTALPAPIRAATSGILASGTAMLTLVTASATAISVLAKVRTALAALSGTAAAVTSSFTGIGLIITALVGVFIAAKTASEEQERAHRELQTQILASSRSYEEYTQMMKDAGFEQDILTEAIWRTVRAKEAEARIDAAKGYVEAENAARDLLEELAMLETQTLSMAYYSENFSAALVKGFDEIVRNDQLADVFSQDEEALRKLTREVAENILGKPEFNQQLNVAIDNFSLIARALDETSTAAERSKAADYLLSLKYNMDLSGQEGVQLKIILDSLIDTLLGVGEEAQNTGKWLEGITTEYGEFGLISDEEITGFLDAVNDALDDANQAIIDAELRRNRAIEDLDEKYGQKKLDAWEEYNQSIIDTQNDLAAFYAGTLQELLDLDHEYLQDRQDAWTKYQQDIADAERDLQRDIEDANRDRLQSIADADADYARDREDALRDLNQDLEDAAEEHAQNLIDIENDRQKSLLELEQEYQDRLYEIQNLAQQKLRDLQDKYAESESDARLGALRQALEYLRDQGIVVSDAYENILRQLFLGGDEAQFANVVQRNVRDIYRALLEELGILQDDQRWEEEDLSDDIDREQERRLDDLEEWLSEEQQAIEEAYQEQIAAEEERYAEEQAARQEDYERKLEDLQRAHERERAEIELSYQRKMDDLRLQHERERAEIEQNYQRRLEDLEIQYNRERELIRKKLEEQNQAALEKYQEALDDITEAKNRERDEINRQYDRTIEDASAKLGQMVREAGEKYGLLPGVFTPTYRIIKDDLYGLLFSDPDSLSNLWQEFINNLQYRILEARSPSRVMMKMGESITAGLEKGMGDKTISDLLTGSFDAMALEANIRSALPVNVASVPGGLGGGNITNSRTSNLVVNANYAHQSESSLRDDLALYNSMLGAWYR